MRNDLRAQENKICHCFHFSPFICYEMMGLDVMILVFLMLSFKPAFSLSFTLIKRPFSSSSLSAIRVVSSAYLRLLIFLPVILIPACGFNQVPFLYFCFYFRYSRRWVIEDLALIYVIKWSAFVFL